MTDREWTLCHNKECIHWFFKKKKKSKNNNNSIKNYDDYDYASDYGDDADNSDHGNDYNNADGNISLSLPPRPGYLHLE